MSDPACSGPLAAGADLLAAVLLAAVLLGPGLARPAAAAPQLAQTQPVGEADIPLAPPPPPLDGSPARDAPAPEATPESAPEATPESAPEPSPDPAPDSAAAPPRPLLPEESTAAPDGDAAPTGAPEEEAAPAGRRQTETAAPASLPPLPPRRPAVPDAVAAPEAPPAPAQPSERFTDTGSQRFSRELDAPRAGFHRVEGDMHWERAPIPAELKTACTTRVARLGSSLAASFKEQGLWTPPDPLSLTVDCADGAGRSIGTFVCQAQDFAPVLDLSCRLERPAR